MVAEPSVEQDSPLLTKLVLAEWWLDRYWLVWAALISFIGLFLRLYQAQLWYLNPDESMHYMVAAYRPLSLVDWYRAAGHVAHPPLFFWLLHGVLQFGDSQIVVRSLGVAAGSLLPIFMMRWVRGFAGTAAATCTLFILTFSPALIDLTSQVRAYALAFLLVSICLNLLEPALQGRIASICWFHFVLCLAILTEFAVVWFVLGVSVCALVVLVRKRARLRIWVAWGTGQALALALYVFLYVTLIARWKNDAAKDEAITGWLSSAFLQQGQNVSVFVLRGTFRQFQYLLGNKPAAILGALAFAVGLFLIGKRTPWRVLLLTVPFAGCAAAAVLHLFPYGATRHSCLLGLLAATGIAPALAFVAGNRILPVLLAGMVLTPLWQPFSDPDPQTISDNRHLTSQMLEAVDYLRRSAPPGSLVVTDSGTAYMLNYYFHAACELPFIPPYKVKSMGGLQVVASADFEFRNDTQLRQAIQRARQDLHWNGPVWVASGGFDVPITNPPVVAPALQDVMAIFQVSRP